MIKNNFFSVIKRFKPYYKPLDFTNIEFRFDIPLLILVAEKDLQVFQKNLEHLKNIGFTDFYVICQDQIYNNVIEDGIKVYKDSEFLSLSGLNNVDLNPWYLQQLVKLLSPSVLDLDELYILDSDTLLCYGIPALNGCVMLLSSYESSSFYYKFITKCSLSLHKNSFVSHQSFHSKEILTKILSMEPIIKAGGLSHFFLLCFKQNIRPSEYQLIGQLRRDFIGAPVLYFYNKNVLKLKFFKFDCKFLSVSLQEWRTKQNWIKRFFINFFKV
ncbi:hypothetical protein [Paraglaciecola sp.]|uniref:hypothetical protein n=1 Tax=Paraglaciecola sp. TaxID=1920173 RepID=UPI003EF9B6E9